MIRHLITNIGLLPLLVGLVVFGAGLNDLHFASTYEPVSTRLPLQAVLDGAAKKDDFVTITDFRLCNRYVSQPFKNDGQRRWITHLGVLPATAPDATDRPRVLVEPRFANEENDLIEQWTQRDTLTGLLKNSRCLAGYERERVRAAYPGINLEHCWVLLEERYPHPFEEAWTCLVVGFLVTLQGVWMLWPNWFRRWPVRK